MRAACAALAEIESEWAGAVGADVLVRLRDALAQVRSLQKRPRSEVPQAAAASRR